MWQIIGLAILWGLWLGVLIGGYLWLLEFTKHFRGF